MDTTANEKSMLLACPGRLRRGQPRLHIPEQNTRLYVVACSTYVRYYTERGDWYLWQVELEQVPYWQLIGCLIHSFTLTSDIQQLIFGRHSYYDRIMLLDRAVHQQCTSHPKCNRQPAKLDSSCWHLVSGLMNSTTPPKTDCSQFLAWAHDTCGFYCYGWNVRHI